jgi:glycosidase
MSDVRYPSLYQINTRVWLTGLSRALGRRATLDDIPDTELDRLAELGFDWVWLLSVWQTGPAAQAISRAHAGWRREFAETLPDLADDDIAGSGFAIQAYTVHRDLGGAEALARVRQRMQQRGLKLMLDFVPNHMAPDHDWIDTHPDYFVSGSEADLARAPHNYCRVQTKNGPLILAHGRDPFFDGWPDTLQLNYGNPALQQAMIDELKSIAGQCDGVRCDMAMLVLPDVFERTWGIRTEPFWPKAAEAVRREHPHFLFMAEVYWDLEWTMQQQGFDYAYDKQLYDRLRDTHLVRAPQEPVDASVQGFYEKLLAVLRQPVFRDGTWSLIELVPAWDGNWTSDCLIVWCWQRDDGERRLVVVNYAGNQSQCYVRIPFVDVIGRTVRLRDLMGSASFDRDGHEVATRGLYLDLPPWGYHVFELTAA